MLDGERAIVRSNTAFARLVGREPAELEGVPILDLCHPEDRARVSAAFDRVAEANVRPELGAGESLDLRVLPAHGGEVWVGLVASSIEPADLSAPLLLAQWVDLSSRRRAEEARAELLMEHAARTHAEAMAERLSKLQALSGAIESLSLQRLLAELAVRLAELFDAEAAEVEIIGHTGEPVTFRAEHGTARRLDPGKPRAAVEHGHDVPIVIEGAHSGVLRIWLPAGRSFTSSERSLMQDAAERAALGIQRAQLHEREHQVAVELQRGLLPKQLPAIDGLELAAHYEAAGAEVGGDWYDAFALPGGRLGVVLGDVAGRGVPAASSMGQLRSVTRAFALADDGFLTPAEMLTRLNRHQLALGQTELFTVVYAIIDPVEGTISWATAGHPPPLVRSSEGWATYLEGGEGLMGIEDIVYRDLRAPLDQESIVIFYTDGLIERRGESLDVGLERLADAFGSGPDDPAELCEYVIEQMRPPGRDLHDDVTALLVKLV
jgi:PAS domain S-box-containing protein